MDTKPIDIIDPTDGRVLYFSCDRFIADIGERVHPDPTQAAMPLPSG
jgi:hypothetical protein